LILAVIDGKGGNTMRIVRYLAWAWLIVIGGLVVTPGGVLCIACGVALDNPGYIGRPATVFVGVVSIVLGIIGIATAGKSISAGQAR
jgi:hypothetical protein